MEKNWDAIEELIEELAAQQQARVLKCARKIIPHLTEDDVLQPNDFLELEHNGFFRYEEGVLAGILSVQMALRAEFNN